MSGISSIEWTDDTWNPVRGCSMAKGSEAGGCLNCYAARISARNLPGMRSPTTGKPFARFLGSGPRWTGKVELVPHLLDWPLRKKKPLRIFVNSMSDLFHEKLSNEAIAAVFGVMAACPQHTFQILTKRPERMREWFGWVEEFHVNGDTNLGGGPLVALSEALCSFDGPLHGIDNDIDGGSTEIDRRLDRCDWPLENVWLGTSVENQATADERIPHLLATPAAKRFVSYEPALEGVRFQRWLTKKFQAGWDAIAARFPNMKAPPAHLGRPGDGLDWVIVGGESGPGARPFDLAWARSTVEQCKAAGVACFVKQLGSRPFEASAINGRFACTMPGAAKPPRYIMGKEFLALRDRKGGDWSEWPEDLRVREFPR